MVLKVLRRPRKSEHALAPRRCLGDKASGFPRRAGTGWTPRRRLGDAFETGRIIEMQCLVLMRFKSEATCRLNGSLLLPEVHFYEKPLLKRLHLLGAKENRSLTFPKKLEKFIIPGS
jgi:hypothetical protein